MGKVASWTYAIDTDGLIAVVSIPYMGKVEQHFVDEIYYTPYILLCQSTEDYNTVIIFS